MNDSRISKPRQYFTRRSLLIGAGSGLAFSLFGNSEVASALNSQISSSANLDPEARHVVYGYFAARAGVTSNRRIGDVLQFISPDSRNLINFESARFGELASLGSSNRWNGVIDSVSSTPEILNVVQSGNSASFLVSDWTAINWRSAPALKPIERTLEEEAIVRKDPTRYGLNVPAWKPIESGFGTEHLITLEFNNGRWLITQDGYQECALSGSSPDYSPNFETNIRSNPPPMSGFDSLKAKSRPARLFQPKTTSLTSYTFDYMAAASYAEYWANSYNSAYSNWGASNADCANFVSQSFKAGGYPDDGTWSPYSYAWVNNLGLRNWLISSGRGHDSSLGTIGYADAINYDWANNGSLDHIVIVTDWNSSGVPLICSHTGAARRVPYYSYYIGAYPNMSLKYTSTYLYYSA